MTFNQIKQVLDRALKDKQASLYAQMKADGTLDPYLNRLAGQIDSQAGEVHNELLNDRQFQSISDPMARVQEANSRIRSAEEVALNQAIEELGSLAEA